MMLSRLNKLELATMLLQRDPRMVETPTTSNTSITAKAALESAISAQHSLLHLPIRSAKLTTPTPAALEAELYDLTQRKNTLEAELIHQTAAVCKVLEEALGVLESKAYSWKKDQADYLMNWLETSTLKMVAVEEQCTRQTYNDANMERLRVIGDTLDRHLKEQQQELSTKKAELALYSRLPQETITEIAIVNAEIAKYNDYCNRLQ